MIFGFKCKFLTLLKPNTAKKRRKYVFKEELDNDISMRKTMVEIELSFWNPLNTCLLEERRYFKGNVTPWKCSMASV